MPRRFRVEFDRVVCRRMRAFGMERTPAEVSRNRARLLNKLLDSVRRDGCEVPEGMDEVTATEWLIGGPIDPRYVDES